MSLKLNTKYLSDFVGADELTGIKAQVEAAAKSLHNKDGLGNDFLGWVNLPTTIRKNSQESRLLLRGSRRIPTSSSLSVSVVLTWAQELLSSCSSPPSIII